MPDYYFTKPITHTALNALQLDPRGLQIDPSSSDRPTRGNRYHGSPTRDKNPAQEMLEQLVYEEINGKRYKKIVRRKIIPKKSMDKHQSPFCRSTKRKIRNVVIYVDDEGNEFTKDELLSNQENTETEKSQAEGDVVVEAAEKPAETVEEKIGETNDKTVSVTETLTIDTGNGDENDAEKENDPNSAHSPRSGRRTRSFSPKGSGEGHSPQRSRSPRTRSPRTRSPRAHSPRVHSPNTQSPQANSSFSKLPSNHRIRFAGEEIEQVELGKDSGAHAVKKVGGH